MYAERSPHVFNALRENLKLLNGRSVGIDIDGVTQATYILALNKVSHTFGKVINREELSSYWELAKIVQKNGVPEDDALEFAKGAWNDDYVYLNSPLMPGIADLLKMFNEASVSYKFISSRPIKFADTTFEFLNKQFSWIKPEDIIIGRKEGENGGDFKANMIDRYNVALHIEDAVEEARLIVRNTNAHVLIVPQSWNDYDRFEHPQIKYFESYVNSNGVWPVVRFLMSPAFKEFFNDVAQCY